MKLRLRGPLKKPGIAKGCLDKNVFASQADETNQQLGEALKKAMAKADSCLADKFHDGEDVNQLVKARAWVVDQLILHAWHSLIPDNEDVSLIAVGGFGRGELHPQSDVDLRNPMWIY
jgi:[protein-PII] uridylyltransferase